MLRRFATISVSLVLASCGSKPSQPEAKTDVTPTAEQPATTPTAEPTPVAQPAAPAEPSTPAPTPEPRVEPEPPAPTLARAPEPPLTEEQRSAGFGRLDKPMPAKVEWQRMAGLDELQKFNLLPLGVLADCEIADYCELDEQGKLVPSKLEIDDFDFEPEEITGAWPDNAWFVDTEIDSIDVNEEPMGLEILLASNWTGKKWAEHKREFRFAVGVGDYMNNRVARAGWSGDLIVCHDSTGKAFNLREPDKVLATFGPNVVWALAQTATGKLLPFRHDENDVRATPPCLGEDCNRLTGGTTIGMDTLRLVLRIDVSRGGDAMSFLFDEGGLSDKQGLLHYDPAGPGDEPESWNFDTLGEERQIAGIWGDELGGLWVNVGGSELLYRSPKGLWFSVAPPEGLVFESFAARARPREFLAYASNPDDAAVFAVRGPITPAPEQPLVMPADPP